MMTFGINNELLTILGIIYNFLLMLAEVQHRYLWYIRYAQSSTTLNKFRAFIYPSLHESPFFSLLSIKRHTLNIDHKDNNAKRKTIPRRDYQWGKPGC